MKSLKNLTKRNPKPTNLLETGSTPFAPSLPKPGFGQRAANFVTTVYGSWGMFFAYFLVLVSWAIFNGVAYFGPWHFDTWPFPLMNILLSIDAAVTPIFILMSTNSSAKAEMALAVEVRNLANLAYTNTETIENLTEVAISTIIKGNANSSKMVQELESLIQKYQDDAKTYEENTQDNLSQIARILQQQNNTLKEIQNRLDSLDSKG